MSKDQTDLYTGMTSVSAESVKTKRDEMRDKKRQLQAELKPGADHILTAIQSERDSIPLKLWELINVDTTKENTKAVAMALKLYDGYLQGLFTEVSNIMRKEKIMEPEDE